ncbi:MAG: hypothetical protein K2L21_07475 [Muribaculaceae bacterium]|nr:hypothetical protein [Muribaculaceae bacterium]
MTQAVIIWWTLMAALLLVLAVKTAREYKKNHIMHTPAMRRVVDELDESDMLRLPGDRYDDDPT